MHHTWEDQVQEYWRTGALLAGDDESTRYINRDLQAEPGRVLPRALWLQSREMPMAERRELDALWVRLMDIAKADADCPPGALYSSGVCQDPQANAVAPDSTPVTSPALKLYELTTNVPYCDGCRDVTWFLWRDGRHKPVAPYCDLVEGHERMIRDPVQCELVDGPERAVNSMFTEDEARLVEITVPLNGNLRVSKRRVSLPYGEYHHRHYVIYDSVHILKKLKFGYELPFPISIYYDIDWASDSNEHG